MSLENTVNEFKTLQDEGFEYGIWFRSPIKMYMYETMPYNDDADEWADKTVKEAKSWKHFFTKIINFKQVKKAEEAIKEDTGDLAAVGLYRWQSPIYFKRFFENAFHLFTNERSYISEIKVKADPSFANNWEPSEKVEIRFRSGKVMLIYRPNQKNFYYSHCVAGWLEKGFMA